MAETRHPLEHARPVALDDRLILALSRRPGQRWRTPSGVEVIGTVMPRMPEARP